MTKLNMTQLPENLKAMLFDWDNTVVDTRFLILDAVNKTLEAFGKPHVSHYLNAPQRLGVFMDLFGEEWEKANMLFRMYLRSETRDEITLFPGFLDFLSYLKSRRIFVGIVSNKYNDLLRKEITLLGLTNQFDSIVGSGDTDEDKPSPKPLLHALSGTSILPSKETVIFVGDSVVDMQCARNAEVQGMVYGDTEFPEFTDIIRINNYYEALKSIKAATI